MREELLDKEVLAMYDVRGIQSLRQIRQKKSLGHLYWLQTLLRMDWKNTKKS